MSKKILLLLALICIVAQCQQLAGSTLTKVIMVFRHGARYPNYNSKAPLYNSKLTSVNSGQLSPVGARQLFQLGTDIRNQYITALNFLPNKFDTTKIYVRSTDVDRTLMSAQSFMSGLYPAPDGPIVPDSILNDPTKVTHLDAPYDTLAPQPAYKTSLLNGFQPVPIRTVQNQYDGSLYIHGNACQNSAQWRADAANSDLFSQYRKYFDQTFNDFEALFGKDGFVAKTATLSTLYDWLDILQCNLWNDYPTFDAESTAYYANADLQKRVNAIVHLQFYLTFFYTEQQKKVVPTPFFKDLLKYTSDTYTTKFTVLSAHDTTINTVLQGLNLVSYECVIEYIKNGMNPVPGTVCITKETDFASNIIFEISTKDSKNYIQVKYNGVYQKICDQTQVYCELSDFQNRIQSWIVPDYDVQCGNPLLTPQTTVASSSSNDAPKWTIALMIIFGVLFGITLVAAFYFFRVSKRVKSFMSAKGGDNNVITTV